MTINEFNVSRFMDNFAIMSDDGITLFGCEHNQQEAEAIAKWITFNRDRKAIVIKNGPDQVRAAKAFRDSDPIRYQLREEALIEMGVWEQPKGRRRK